MKAVFLDRDGVINVDHGYVGCQEKFEFIPGALEACAKLHREGFALVVVTNQSGIARGYYDEHQFAELSNWMAECFAQAGAPLTGIFHCPHHPDIGDQDERDCSCRKPKPGMLLEAAANHKLTLNQSFMVGDKTGDLQAGIAAEVKGVVLVKTGKPVSEQGVKLADFVGDSLVEAADWICQSSAD